MKAESINVNLRWVNRTYREVRSAWGQPAASCRPDLKSRNEDLLGSKHWISAVHTLVFLPHTQKTVASLHQSFQVPVCSTRLETWKKDIWGIGGTSSVGLVPGRQWGSGHPLPPLPSLCSPPCFPFMDFLVQFGVGVLRIGSAIADKLSPPAFSFGSADH